MDKLTTLNESYEQMRAIGACRTKSEFAELLGINRSGLSAAMNGNPTYLTDSLINKVLTLVSKYAIEKDGTLSYSVPIFPTSARGGSLCDMDEGHAEVECERIVSPIKGATMAMYIYGESMEPEFTSGSLILLKKIDPALFIEWGCVYVLDTVNGAVCKRISKGSSEDCVLCESINPKYQSFEVSKDAIRGWWRVLMNMSMK